MKMSCLWCVFAFAVSALCSRSQVASAQCTNLSTVTVIDISGSRLDVVKRQSNDFFLFVLQDIDAFVSV